jgi:hypothetical protein
MHFEFLVEDSSGKEALKKLVPKIIGDEHTFQIHGYRGIGHLPHGLRTVAEPQHRALLSQLPRLLQGYGATFNGYPADYEAALVLVCDIDKECRHDFRQELLDLLGKCHPRPITYFCIAEEEIEAWYLGDKQAITTTYSKAKSGVLESYVPDSICNTWEVLADAVHSGGAKALKKRQYYEIGAAKCTWAREIAPRMNVENNESPSFRYFRDKMRQAIVLAGCPTSRL